MKDTDLIEGMFGGRGMISFPRMVLSIIPSENLGSFFRYCPVVIFFEGMRGIVK